MIAFLFFFLGSLFDPYRSWFFVGFFFFPILKIFALVVFYTSLYNCFGKKTMLYFDKSEVTTWYLMRVIFVMAFKALSMFIGPS